MDVGLQKCRVSSLRDCARKTAQKKAQIAMEYLMIMGFVLAALSPLIVVYYVYTQGSTEELTASQLSKIAKEVVDSAEEVYYLGEPSQISMRVYVPGKLEGAQISGKQFVLLLQTQNGPAEIVETSAVNISGSFPLSEGIYTLTVRAVNGYTNISYR
jgi:uncharacterized protein (UPF0333 family)